MNMTVSGPGRRPPSCNSLFDPRQSVNVSCDRVTINLTIVVDIAHILGLFHASGPGLVRETVC
jgi:hypothetical protein